MVPSWVLTTLIIVLGGIFACYLGATLPEYEILGFYILIFAIACTLCAVTSNFPILLALATWTPFGLPVPGFRNFPSFALAVGWAALLLFFRMCLTGTLQYTKSYNALFLICLAWVPIRFIMNPVHKLGAGVAGGSGVSGATPYFLYVVAAATLILLGAILNTRERVVQYMLWCYRFCFLIGIALIICAFTPSTEPFLASMGMYVSASLNDGIQRLVVLPGYGLILFEVSLCPNLFRLSRFQSVLVFTLGFAMMIVGGNRSAMAAAIIAVPVTLFLRRKTHALVLSVLSMVAGVAFLHISVSQMNPDQVPALFRSFGMLDTKIDDSTGGTDSAQWRYAVWQSGLSKIMQAPLIGWGYGNLPEYLDPTQAGKGTADFEAILAGGEAHNGFVSAAYAFGIPFTLALTVGFLVRMVSHSRSALTTDPHDPELRDLHAFVGCTLATYPILIYTAFEMSVLPLWIFIAIGIIVDHLPRRSTLVQDPIPTVQSRMGPSPVLSPTHRMAP
jgi:hypothetical protein